ncbi:DUF2867 domain-containing protein [Blastococcus sp. CT_GayMR20]|uniref:DUF2867 domain-containing protein n=1 Tax=Blastococcus sp. CT_GayMR20 TaxID=2559609 RepID=UPI0010741419|nr:DUF2867 domain-containing protein [Blastococcus sp. CT_GayMR20]TFV75614.1 DUF2867 domain-containing protein [Blastococcus sp. CT_GayMR20]
MAGPDGWTAEEWLRAGLEEAPALLRRVIVAAHRHVLGFRLAPPGVSDSVLGWRTATVRPEVIRLEAAGPLLDGVIVGRRLETRTVLTTSLRYRRPVLARFVWLCVGPLHRRIAPYLLERAAALAGAAR